MKFWGFHYAVTMDTINHKVFKFQGFLLDVRGRSLRNGAHDIKLRPKSFDVLCILVASAGRLLTKDEVIDAVWPNVTVTDELLAQCVRDIRLALHDCEHRIIKTVPRRGYVFATPVLRAAIDDRPEPPLANAIEKRAAATRRDGRLAAIAGHLASSPMGWLTLVALAAIGASLMLWRQPGGIPVPERPSIAVLPFDNIAGDAQQRYFSDGLTEDITTRLALVPDLFVAARDSAFAYRDRHDDPRRVGRELGVRYLVEGSVRRDGERLRITTRLIDSVADAQRWAQSYDSDFGDPFAVQDEVRPKIVMTLVARIKHSELERVRRKPPEALAAYDYYVRGNAALTNLYEGGGEAYGPRLLEARQLLSQAVATDPHYASAIVALADSYIRSWLTPTDFPLLAHEFQQEATIDRALALAREAVANDTFLADAHAELAWILHWQYRRDEALAEFSHAFELSPNMPDGRWAVLLTHDGRAAEAIDFMKRTMRRDPLHRPMYFNFLAGAYYLVGQDELAVENSRLAAGRAPGVAQAVIWHAAAAAQLGRDEEARAASADLLRLQPGFTIAKFLRMIRFARPQDADRLADGLRKAGLPE